MAAVNRRPERGSLALTVTIGENDPCFGGGCSFLFVIQVFFLLLIALPAYVGNEQKSGRL